MTVTVPPSPAGSPRRKTLIVHIGDRKTGSTAIQTAIAKQQVALEAGSIFYPARLSHNWFKPHFRAYAEGAKPALRNKAAAAFDRLAGRIRDSSDDICLISTETFESAPPAILHRIVTTHFAPVVDEVRVIAYVRPHAARLLSSFAERLKSGGKSVVEGDLEGFFEQFHKAGRLDYHPRFSALKDLFGDAFTLRPMIRSQLYRGSVIDDFIRHGLGTGAYELHGGDRANESLDLVDLMRLKLVQEILIERHPGKQPRHAFGWEFARVLAHMPPPDTRRRLQLHRALADRLHAACLADARALDRDFFGGEGLMQAELDAARDTAVADRQSTDPADYLSPAEIRTLTVLAQILSGMLSKGGQDWQAFFNSNRYGEVLEGRGKEADAEEDGDA